MAVFIALMPVGFFVGKIATGILFFFAGKIASGILVFVGLRWQFASASAHPFCQKIGPMTLLRANVSVGLEGEEEEEGWQAFS